MKPGLILKPEGWHLIPDVPEEPKWHEIPATPTGDDYEIRDEQRDEYELAIQQAKDTAILVENQEVAFNAVLAEYPIMSGPDEPGKIYHVEVNYRIRDKCRYMEIDGRCPDCFRGSLCEKVAILHPPKEEQIELVEPDLGEIIAKVHDSMEGRYDLTEEDLHTIHYLLGKLQ
jgi:hypothetical protein